MRFKCLEKDILSGPMLRPPCCVFKAPLVIHTYLCTLLDVTATRSDVRARIRLRTFSTGVGIIMIPDARIRVRQQDNGRLALMVG